MAATPFNSSGAQVDDGALETGGSLATPSATNTNITPPSSVSTPKPISVVGPQPAVNQVSKAQAIVNNPPQVQPSAYNGVLDANGLLVNPPDAKFDRNTGKPLTAPIVPPTPPPVPTSTPGNTTAEDQVNNEGKTLLYNTTNGKQEWVDDAKLDNGKPPTGYSLNNPQGGAVTNSVTNLDGTTINQYADGHYGFIDAAGNYNTATAAAFTSAQNVNTAQTSLNNLNKGILTPVQQLQVTGLNQTYQNALSKLGYNQLNLGGALNALNAQGTLQAGPNALTNLITNGAQDIQDKQNEQASALAALVKSFNTEDTDAINQAYSQYKTATDTIEKSINDLQTQANALADKADTDLTNYTFQQMNNHPDAKITLGMTPSQIQDAVTNSETFKSKQSIVDTTPIDGNAPDPDTANTPSSITGKTPNALWQDANDYALSGKTIQSYVGGLSSANQSNAYKAAISNKSAAILQAAGITDKTELQAEYKANSSALNGLTKYMNNMDLYLSKAEDSVNQVTQAFSNANINTYDSTYLNQTLNGLQKNLTDSADLRAYQAGIADVASDYTQVFTRGGVMSDAARESAADILSGNITLKDFIAVTNELQSQGQINKTDSIKQMQKVADGGTDQVAKYFNYIANAPQGGTASGGNSTSGGTTSTDIQTNSTGGITSVNF